MPIVQNAVHKREANAPPSAFIHCPFNPHSQFLCYLSLWLSINQSLLNHENDRAECSWCCVIYGSINMPVLHLAPFPRVLMCRGFVSNDRTSADTKAACARALPPQAILRAKKRGRRCTIIFTWPSVDSRSPWGRFGALVGDIAGATPAAGSCEGSLGMSGGSSGEGPRTLKFQRNIGKATDGAHGCQITQLFPLRDLPGG